jgi:hypothetical protein
MGDIARVNAYAAFELLLQLGKNQVESTLNMLKQRKAELEQALCRKGDQGKIAKELASVKKELETYTKYSLPASIVYLHGAYISPPIECCYGAIRITNLIIQNESFSNGKYTVMI